MTHKHDHHHHGEESCSCEKCSEQKQNCWIKGRMHDEAVVISAECKMTADYTVISQVITQCLAELAQKINECGGVIGHIKTAAEIKAVDLYSVTDTAVSVRHGSEQDIMLQIAAIVFFVEQNELQQMVQTLLLDKVLAAKSENTAS